MVSLQPSRHPQPFPGICILAIQINRLFKRLLGSGMVFLQPPRHSQPFPGICILVIQLNRLFKRLLGSGMVSLQPSRHPQPFPGICILAIQINRLFKRLLGSGMVSLQPSRYSQPFPVIYILVIQFNRLFKRLLGSGMFSLFDSCNAEHFPRQGIFGIFLHRPLIFLFRSLEIPPFTVQFTEAEKGICFLTGSFSFAQCDQVLLRLPDHAMLLQAPYDRGIGLALVQAAFLEERDGFKKKAVEVLCRDLVVNMLLLGRGQRFKNASEPGGLPENQGLAAILRNDGIAAGPLFQFLSLVPDGQELYERLYHLALADAGAPPLPVTEQRIGQGVWRIFTFFTGNRLDKSFPCQAHHCRTDAPRRQEGEPGDFGLGEVAVAFGHGDNNGLHLVRQVPHPAQVVGGEILFQQFAKGGGC